ncbi:MAG TPA: carboxypeptidase-like regulatory domain-containing protein [Kofleriaceae bacterium]|nr:carboxypeptidase-like regulatory domain-containing protein [Kofleriaceae bacterium]
MRLLWSSLLVFAALGCGNHDGGGKGNPDAAPDSPTCEGIGCKQVQCTGGGTTSISGTVFAPNGTLPIYNATVYVPLRPLDPIVSGASCDRCAELSGNPLVRTTTDEQGRFTLTNVPATTDVPVVIQVGKWRRVITVPSVPECTDTAVATGMTRLPKNKTEGDMPRMALATGEADALECMLRKIGIDESEITNSAGTGRVHLFQGAGGTGQFDAARGGATFTGAATTLWDTEAKLSAYDVVFLSCEGEGNRTVGKTTAAKAAMRAYADKGGKVFTSHWHLEWLAGNTPPWDNAITFYFNGHATGETTLPDLGNITADIDATFPKSDALSKWLLNVGASTVRGKIDLRDAQHTAIGFNPTYTERWIHYPAAGARRPSVQYASLTTPLEKPATEKCGRVVFSDIHVSSGDLSANNLLYPSGGCTTNVATLSPQEKVLAFMMFDIASCVGDPIE